MPQVDRDIFVAKIPAPDIKPLKQPPKVTAEELLRALHDVLERARLNTSHQVQKEVLSVRERMSNVLHRVKADQFTRFDQLFTFEEGRMGVVVTFIAVLELLRQSLVEMVQSEPYGPIHVKAAAA